jgi:hypothetical protein
MTSRVRQSPHVEGNYSTIIYIRPSIENIEALRGYVLQAGGTPIPETEWHMSLTRGLNLNNQIIQKFLEKFSNYFKTIFKFSIYLKNNLIRLKNENSNSLFSCLPADPSINPTLFTLLREIDSLLAEFDFPPFYSPPKPHISLAVSLGAGEEGEESFEWADEAEAAECRIDVACIDIQIGSTIHTIPLR